MEKSSLLNMKDRIDTERRELIGQFPPKVRDLVAGARLLPEEQWRAIQYGVFDAGVKWLVEHSAPARERRHYTGDRGEIKNLSKDNLLGELKKKEVAEVFIGGDPGNPESSAKLAYVLKNPSPYIEPAGMQRGSAWRQLTEEEQTTLTPKLELKETRLPNGKTRTETPQEAFDRLIGKHPDTAVIAERVVAVRNAMDTAGAHRNSNVWRLIRSFDGVYGDRGVTVVFTANNGKDLLNALRNSGYVVDGFLENAKYFEPLAHGKLEIGEPHKHSARFLTRRAQEISPHWTQEKNYPDTRFDLHWDPESATCKDCTLQERKHAGKAHSDPGPYPPTETRERLKQQGIVPGR